MPRWKRPDEIRTKAMRSRCCGSILACTLNTKPATGGSSGEIGRGSAGCGRGAGANSPTPAATRARRNCSAHCRNRPASHGPPDRPHGRMAAQPLRHLDLLSNGSRPSRSSLLTKAKIGTSRSRQTSKSLRGLLLGAPSAPLGAASSTITAVSTAVRVR
jgi:hypothetical protein